MKSQRKIVPTPAGVVKSEGMDGSDEELMLRVKDGDRRAFNTLFDRHHRAILRLTGNLMKSRARAEECTQDTFVKLFRAAPGYTPTARFRTFLFRIATNHCFNELRRSHHAPEGASSESLSDARDERPGPERQVELRQFSRTLQGALEALGERERAAFTLCRLDGLSYAEVAEALELSLPATRSLIHRATLAVAAAVGHLQHVDSPTHEAQGT